MELQERFLVNTEQTGRFIVTSVRTGKKYFVEPIGDPHVEWGSVDPANGRMMVKKGWGKNKGSVDADDSLITKENGFEKIHNLKPGESPLMYIEKLDAQYPTI